MKKDFVKYKKTILIDLDGVLNQYDGHFDINKIPPVRTGIKDFYEKFYLFLGINSKLYPSISAIIYASFNVILSNRNLCESF